ncbi:MAG: urease accessory UreF family protein [Actinomycetota bacterium]
MGRPLALLLGDGRFPTGGHAHSTGLERAVASGSIASVADVEAWCAARVDGAGRVDAALAAWCARRWPAVDVSELDREVEVRLVSPTQRSLSRRLGRQWTRTGRRIAVDGLGGLPDEPHRVVAVGAVGAAVGLGPSDVAAVIVHDVVAEATSAAIRLLGLDPFEVAGIHVRLTDLLDEVVVAAVEASAGSLGALPVAESLLSLVALDEQASSSERLFAS